MLVQKPVPNPKGHVRKRALNLWRDAEKMNTSAAGILVLYDHEGKVYVVGVQLFYVLYVVHRMAQCNKTDVDFFVHTHI